MEVIRNTGIYSGWPRFGSVRSRFGDGTVRAVPVFGSGGSSKEGGFCVLQYSFTGRTVPVSVPGKRFRRFRFRVRFLRKRFQRFRFPVPVSGSGSVPEPPCLLKSGQCKFAIHEVIGLTPRCHAIPSHDVQRVLPVGKPSNVDA